MALKELLDKIASKLPADADSELTSALADAKREAQTVLSDLSSANAEAKKYRESLRAKEAELETAKAEVEKHQSPEAKKELERLKAIEKQFQDAQAAADAKLKADWETKSKNILVDKTSKLYEKAEKVKGKFTFAPEGQELTIDQIKQNLSAYELLETTGYFTTETKDAGGKAPINKANPPEQFKFFKEGN